MDGFALKEREGGNGIMYSSHIYPWKSGWAEKALVAAGKYPLFIGEVGNIRSWEDFSFIPRESRREDLSSGEWPKDMLGLIQERRLNWTGFSFHPHCGPSVIADWSYAPTPYWGVYVKAALEGSSFKLSRRR